MGLNSPLTSAGATGFKSHVSSCEGPPHMNIKMQALARPLWLSFPEMVCANRSATLKPKIPKPPTRSISRRDMPMIDKKSLHESLPEEARKLFLISPGRIQLASKAGSDSNLAGSRWAIAPIITYSRRRLKGGQIELAKTA